MSQVKILQDQINLLKKRLAVKQDRLSTDNKPSSWALKDWEEAVVNGFLQNDRPQENITRQEIAVAINRLRHNFNNQVIRIISSYLI